MAVIFSNRIIERAIWTENRFTINDVPFLWKDKTLIELANRGYDNNGNRLASVA